MYKKYSIIIARDECDRVLLGRRNDTDKFTNPGGGAEKNECPYHCAVREFEEETGVRLESVKLLKTFLTSDKNLIYLFEGILPEKFEFDTSNDPDKEVEEWVFIDPFDVIDELHVPIEYNEVIKYWANN